MTADQAMLTRRDALKGLAGILLAGAAPFYVPARNLMRVKPIVAPRMREYRWNFYALGPDCEILGEHQVITRSGISKIQLPRLPAGLALPEPCRYYKVEGPVGPMGGPETGLPGFWFSYTVDKLEDLALCPLVIA